ncbi:hypothetical protein COBT_002596, partial [Conglomerata obtusa]
MYLCFFYLCSQYFCANPIYKQLDSELVRKNIKKINFDQYSFEDGFGASWTFFVAVDGSISDEELQRRLDLTLVAVQECIVKVADQAMLLNIRLREDHAKLLDSSAGTVELSSN